MRSSRFSESLLGALGVLWGIWLVVFHSYQVSPVLAALREWNIPEWLMVVWPMLAGTSLLVLPSIWRRPIHLVMCPFWLFVTMSIAETNIALTAVPVYATVGLLHAGLYVLGRDNR